jgi:hypothetical protein
MTAVRDETGLPYDDVRKYVKYDRLIPELKEVVDQGMPVNVALRAQDAVAVTGRIDPKEAVKLAIEMKPMSGPQRKNIHEEIKKNPETTVDEAIEDAKSGGKITTIMVTLGAEAHASLSRFASEEETTLDDAASSILEEGLISKGYM